MTQEQKDLLLKDLCARLPYGVKLHCSSNVITCIGPYTLDTIVLDRFCNKNTEYVPFDEVKPYLFPMSKAIEEIVTTSNKHLAVNVDFFHKNHIDYRGLIEKGLAIDATGLNIY